MNKPVLYLLYAFAVATVLAMSATTIVLALLILFFFKDLFQKTIRKEDFKKDSLLYILLYAWKAFTRALATSVKEITNVGGIWNRIPYIIIGFYRINRDAVVTIFHILFTANSVIVAYAFGQKYLNIPSIYKPLFYHEDMTRISGYFGHPNQYAGCISIILLVNLCVAIYLNKRFFLYTPLLLTGLVFSGSRSFFLGVFVCFVILIALSKSAKAMLKYSAVALLILVLIFVTVPWFSQKISDGFSLEKNAYRLNFWKIAWNTFRDHPVVGVGSGNLPTVLAPYKEKGLIDNTAHAHSLYLHALAEDGVPGFLLLVGLHIYFSIKYFKVFSASIDPLLKAFSLAVAFAFVNLLVAGIFENTFGHAIIALNINFLMGVLEGYRLSDPQGESMSLPSFG